MSVTHSWLAALRVNCRSTRSTAVGIRGKLLPSSGGTTDPNGDHAWTLNGGQGGRLSNGFVLKAAMQYRIVAAEGEMGPWRVTTDGYMYSVEDKDRKSCGRSDVSPLRRTLGCHAASVCAR